MKLVIEGTEEEIKRCMEKLHGEKFVVEGDRLAEFKKLVEELRRNQPPVIIPYYPVYPTPVCPTPYTPIWGTPRQPWELPFTTTGVDNGIQ